MKRIEAWLAKERRRHLRQPRLVDALLGSRALAYVTHRLRYVTLRVVLRTVLHIVEIVALSQVFSPRYLGPILVLRHATLLFSSAYWGALEAQRRALRQAHQQRDATRFDDLRRRWEANALIVVVLQPFAVGAVLWLVPRRFPGFSIYDAYAIACGIRLALDTWARTKQSAVFSIARVYRPLWSMLLVDCGEVCGLLVAWLKIGAFAFALMLVVAGLVRSGFTLWFTRQTRIRIGLAAPTRAVWHAFRRGTWHALPYAQALKFALLNLGLQIDSIAILLLSSGIGGEAGIVLSLSLHALSPLLGAGFSWSRVFYFDFVHLGNRVPLLIVRRFGRLLDRVAITYPILLAALVLPLVDWLVPGLLAATESLLGAMVVARSLFALRQMEAYSYADYRAQLRQSAILLVVTAIVLACSHQVKVVLAGVAIGMVLGATLGRRAQPAQRNVDPGTTLGPEAFIDWLQCWQQPVHLALLRIDRRLAPIGRIETALGRRGFDGPRLQTGPTHLLLAIPQPDTQTNLHARLIRATAGTLRAVVVSEQFENGMIALEQFKPASATEPGGSSASAAGYALGLDPVVAAGVAAASSLDGLIAEFTLRFPDGARLSERSGNLRTLGGAARDGLPAILAELGDRTGHPRRKTCPVEVAVYRPKGEARQVFVLPATSPRKTEFFEFRRRVVASSIRNSFERAPEWSGAASEV